MFRGNQKVKPMDEIKMQSMNCTKSPTNRVGRCIKKFFSGACPDEEILSNTIARQDWKGLREILDDDSMKKRRFRKEISERCVLHDAIMSGAPEHILMIIAEKFPKTLSKANEKDQYPLHIACASGSSPQLISRCVDKCPSSVAALDVDGRAPIHLLSKSYNKKCSRYVPKHTIEKHMIDILWMLYDQAPAIVASDDFEGVGAIEYGIESDAGIDFIKVLQDMVSEFHKGKKTSKSKLEIFGSRFRDRAPRAALAA